MKGVLFLYAALSLVLAGAPPSGAFASPQQATAIAANDNRAPAGQFIGHELHLALVARWGRWYPDGPQGEAVPIQAFGQNGKALQIPGPLIRVPLRSVVSVSIRNAIAGARLTVHGLVDRPALRDEPFDVPYGQTRTIKFHAGAVGTFLYWAATTKAGSSIDSRFGADSQLGGAIVVDPPRSATVTPSDRIFVISEWDNVRAADGSPKFPYLLLALNGRSWPHTEHLSYTEGSTVRWRLVNTSFEGHPFHLHGFFFSVDSRGDGVQDVLYEREAGRDHRVTELVEPGHTLTLMWQPTRPGNWLFHCHLAYHARAHVPISQMLDPKPMMRARDYEYTFLRNAGMGGLILAVSVRGPQVRYSDPPVSRHIGLTVEPAVDNQPAAPSFKYVLRENGNTVTEPGAVGPPIVLTRGVPVAIDVTNDLSETTAVHWHGIEVQDSYYDGVPGFSGEGHRVAPMIAPGQTFEAVLVPPRAGTFIYHTHMDDIYQLRGGLAGPLIVMDQGQTFDPSTDHVFTVTTTHSLADALKIFVNGEFQPPPLSVKAGVPQRLRFINISTFWTNLIISLGADGRTLQWQPFATDGYELPLVRQAPQFAVTTLTTGSTADFVITPARGDSTLQIWPDRGFPPVTIPIHAT